LRCSIIIKESNYVKYFFSWNYLAVSLPLMQWELKPRLPNEIAQIIQDSDADYCLALKGNHKYLHEFVQQLFAQAQAHSGQEIEHSFYRTIAQDHGRTEIRRYWTMPTGEFFFESERWAGLQSIGLVESVRKIGQQTTTSKRYYLNSFVSDARL
jgi:predicted transposase YbfD/YdcC